MNSEKNETHTRGGGWECKYNISRRFISTRTKMETHIAARRSVPSLSIHIKPLL